MSFLEKIKISRRLKKEEDKVFETLEEIIDAREERGDAHLVDARELPMLKNLFQLRDVRAKDVMTPRVDIVALPVDMKRPALSRCFLKEKFSRYPVYEGSLDNIVGVLHAKDVLFSLLQKEKIKISDLMKKEVLFVSPTMRALDLLKIMQKRQIQLAIVVDEHGGADGLVALEDLLEVVVGEIDDEHDEPEEEMLKRLDATTLEVNAKLRLDELKKETDLNFEEDITDDIDTVGGLITHLTGRVPAKGEVIHHSKTGIRFLILSSNPLHIEKVRIMNIPQDKKKEEKK